ncbi:hypothetical protein JTE90_028403 [Oedothorax gibbosus]|uniref:Uncharacterized protein n=1 Tax=Oedothorax gibbosus TaxID=931172 RepID=A0AAV6VEV8_9ARAC|nr:hypothetical protein JTE90_028403 [Oedothorax gibbosus]
MFETFLFILCLAGVLVSAERGCPYPEDVQPCRCVEFVEGGEKNEMVCVGVHDTEALLRVFENSRRFHFSELTLWNSSLQYIPHQIFDDVMVKNLYMKDVTLRIIFDEVPISDPGLTHLWAYEVCYLFQ